MCVLDGREDFLCSDVEYGVSTEFSHAMTYHQTNQKRTQYIMSDISVRFY